MNLETKTSKDVRPSLPIACLESVAVQINFQWLPENYNLVLKFLGIIRHVKIKTFFF